MTEYRSRNRSGVLNVAFVLVCPNFMHLQSTDVVNAALSDATLARIKAYHARWCTTESAHFTQIHLDNPLATLFMNTLEIEKLLSCLGSEHLAASSLQCFHPTVFTPLLAQFRPNQDHEALFDDRLVIIGARDVVVNSLLCNIQHAIHHRRSIRLRFNSNTETSTSDGFHWFCGQLHIIFD